NSRLLSWLYPLTSNKIVKENFPRLSVGDLKQLPIRAIDFAKPEEKKMHDDLVSLVDKMLDLHKQIEKASFDSEKEPIARQINATDKKIDQLVYQLYGLTEEEIKIVEGGNE
ncbi:MAG: restriction endonuclease subunit R, partial [Bacteroidota bacterium]